MTNLPQPGDFGLTTIEHRSISWWVNLGQALIGDGSRYTHAFIVVDNDMAVEAAPRGARLVSLDSFRDREVLYSTNDFRLTAETRKTIASAAMDLVGTSYSFLDYLALALDHWGIQPKRLRQYITSKGHMICSQLVDECYRRAGIGLFNDGRLCQDVTPGDLLYLLLDD